MAFELCKSSKELARGSFGSVSFGRLGDTDVVVKEELAISISDSGVLQEVDVWTSLPPHPNVVKGILSGSVDVEGAYTVFINVLPVYKSDYRNALYRTKKRQRRLMDVAVFQMCMGVKHMHDNGYVHGDLKDRNVLSKGKDVACVALADFGLSFRWSEGQPPFMYSGGSLGRPNTVIGATEYDTSAVDIFALGLVLGGSDSYFYREWVQNQDDLVDTSDGKWFMKIVRNCINSSMDIRTKKRKKMAYDLYLGMFNPDINMRFTIDQVINHPYFEEIREKEMDKCLQQVPAPYFRCGDLSLVDAFEINYTNTRVRDDCPIYGVDIDTLRFILNNTAEFLRAIREGIQHYVDNSEDRYIAIYRRTFRSRKICIDMVWVVGRYIHLVHQNDTAVEHIIPSPDIIAQIYIAVGLMVGIGQNINTELVSGRKSLLNSSIMRIFKGVVAPTEIRTKRAQIYKLRPVILTSGVFGDYTPIKTTHEEVFTYWDWCVPYVFDYFTPDEAIQRIFCDGLWGDEMDIMDNYYSIDNINYADDKTLPVRENSNMLKNLKKIVDWVFSVHNWGRGRIHLQEDTLSLTMKLIHDIVFDCVMPDGNWKTTPAKFGVVMTNSIFNSMALVCINVAGYYTHFLPTEFSFETGLLTSITKDHSRELRESISNVYTSPLFEKRTSYGYLNNMLGLANNVSKTAISLLKKTYLSPITFMYHPHEVAQTIMNVVDDVGGEGVLYDVIQTHHTTVVSTRASLRT